LPPLASFVAGFGLCETTSPFGTVFERDCVTLPVLQLAAVIFLFAVASGLPLTFGTMHLGGAFFLNVAVTVFAALIVTVHEPVPLHAPLQPANVEPLPAVRFSVTVVL